MTWNNEDKVPSGISQQLQNITNRLSPILEKKERKRRGREGGKEGKKENVLKKGGRKGGKRK